MEDLMHDIIIEFPGDDRALISPFDLPISNCDLANTLVYIILQSKTKNKGKSLISLHQNQTVYIDDTIITILVSKYMLILISI
jgi:hypothetical protein